MNQRSGSLTQALRAELRRTNFAGRRVSLVEGGVVAVSATVLAAGRRATDGLALAGITALGLADDVLEPRMRRAGATVSKGLRGHARALRSGHVTTGAAKALGIPVLCLAAAATGPRETEPGPVEPSRVRRGLLVLLDGTVAACAANMANLLDLRPGRALKVLVPSAAVAACGPVSTPRARSGRDLARRATVIGIAALPSDLREHGMLGDTGANVFGALVGLAATRRLSVTGRAGLLAVLGSLTLLSERVSFSAVIDDVHLLHVIDRWGRLPVPADDGPVGGPDGTEAR